MDEVAEILGRLVAILVFRGCITDKDKDFICGNISEDEWIDKEG